MSPRHATEFWQFYICALGYIDNVFLNHGGIPQVPPLYVHLDFFRAGQVRGVILRLTRHFIVSGLLHREKLCGGGWWPIVL